jgi:hypothetical protein
MNAPLFRSLFSFFLFSCFSCFFLSTPHTQRLTETHRQYDMFISSRYIVRTTCFDCIGAAAKL